jgi:pimeloyl-ACP methyl ester carboxylesterase
MLEGSVEANGLKFAYLEEGSGPLVLLLHGFPDNAITWQRVIPALAEHKYRAVAPCMRGYAPTTAPQDGRYDPAALADDVAGLIDALNDGEPAFVVGHDWGASATYAAMALHPRKIRRAVTIALGPPGSWVRILERPELLRHAFHFWLFQIPGIAESAVSANNFALIEYLWKLWSPGHQDPEHIKRVKETLAWPNAVEQALGYYRAVLQFPVTHPEIARRMQAEPLTVPTLLVVGGNDRGHEMSEGQERHFAGEYRREVVAGAGHFVQREQAEVLTRLIVDWLKE